MFSRRHALFSRLSTSSTAAAASAASLPSLSSPNPHHFSSRVEHLCQEKLRLLDDQTTAAAAFLESCADPRVLAQAHAHVVRRHLLRAPFHWNALMRAWLRLVKPLSSLRLLVQMLRSGALPDFYTLPIALKAVSQFFAVASGLQMHALAVKLDLDRHEFTESGLISVYTKSGEFECARRLFDHNPDRKIGSWNALINGLTQRGCSDEAVNVFIGMRRSGLVPDDVTMVSVASACGSLGDLRLSQQVHKCVFQAECSGRLDVMLSNSLVDMYAKCGRTDLAYQVFSRMVRRNVSSWTAMIMGLAMHGEEHAVLQFFRAMQEEGVRPNHVTFVGILSACAHKGLVAEGMQYLNVMEGEYGIQPTVAHYGCVVDMLGRVGQLEKAREVVESMPMKANVVIWGTLLGACEKHGNIEVGNWAAKKLIELEPWNDGVYVVLSNIYASAEMWEDVQRIRRMMKDRRVAKAPGYSLPAVAG